MIPGMETKEDFNVVVVNFFFTSCYSSFQMITTFSTLRAGMSNGVGMNIHKKVYSMGRIRLHDFPLFLWINCFRSKRWFDFVYSRKGMDSNKPQQRNIENNRSYGTTRAQQVLFS